MTGRDAIKLALAFVSETSNSTLQDFALKNGIGWLNMLLAESWDTENSIRAYNGDKLLDEPQALCTLDDEINYDVHITAIALPYGLASFFNTDDDEDYRASDYRARFVNALNEAARGNQTTTSDVYAGGVF